jgi:DNA-binding CsgD family transcriptional regulator
MDQEIVLDVLTNEDHQAALAVINWLSNCQTRADFNQLLKTALIPLMNCSGVFYVRRAGEQSTVQLMGSINQSTCCQHSWERFLKTTMRTQIFGNFVTSNMTPRVATNTFGCGSLYCNSYPLDQSWQQDDCCCTIVTLFDAPGQIFTLYFCRLSAQEQLYSQRDIELLKILRPILMQTIKLVMFQEESLNYQKIIGRWPSQAEPMAILCEDGTTVFQNHAFEQSFEKEKNTFLSTAFSIVRIIKQKKIVVYSFLSKLGKRLYEITLTLVSNGIGKNKGIYFLRLSRITNQIGKIFSQLNRIGLTNRELEIAMLIYQGISPREISENINLSYHTVRNHLKSIYKKMGISTRSEMLVWIG